MFVLNVKGLIPTKVYPRDFCFDCVATSCKEIAPNVYEYGLGFAAEFERFNRDYAFGKKKWIYSLDFRPRSSVWKTGMVLSNCVGTGDEDYRGEYKAVFYHVLPDMPKYEIGDRVVQMKIGLTPRFIMKKSDRLSDTKRGYKGFGSTGK